MVIEVTYHMYVVLEYVQFIYSKIRTNYMFIVLKYAQFKYNDSRRTSCVHS